MSRNSCMRASPSLSKRQTAWTASRRTTTTSSPRWLCVERTASGRLPRKRSTSAWAMCRVDPSPSLLGEKLAEEAALLVVGQRRRPLHGVERVPLRLDLLLEDLEAVEHLLGTRRTAGHVDVHRDDAVGALHRGVVVVEAARR